MPKLPTVTGPEAVAAFEQLGFVVARIKGAHHNMKRDGHPYVLTIPVHGNEPIAPGTLRSLIRAAGVTIEEFTALL
jgi:predicted RNA binding protein YcfA (HicA-like mRNA interferase family)